MPDAKLHHYVPQFYLRRFADPSGRLWLWDRDRDRVFRAKPNGVAAENHFYYLEEMAERGHDPLLMEKQLSVIEGDAARIMDRWLEILRQCGAKEKISITDDERDDIAIYFATQFLRTADVRQIISEWADSHRDAGPLHSEERRKLHVSVLWDDQTFQWIKDRIYNSIWAFGRNHTSLPFFTSDNPIAFRTGDNSMWVKVG